MTRSSTAWVHTCFRPQLPLALLLGIGLASGRPAAAETPAAAPGPVLAVGETTQDGGTVEQGAVVKYRFTLANRGQADLEILQVKPSCGCTVPTWDRVIKPGAEGVIEAEVDTLSFRGPIRKRLTVHSNDPARPQLDLGLTATVIPQVEVTPGLTALLSVEDGPVTQEFTLERTGGRPMQVLAVSATHPSLRTELTPLPGQGRFKLTVTASPQTPPGRTSAAVIVKTDLARAGTVTFSVTLDRGIATVPPLVFWNLTGGAVQTPVRSEVTLSRPKRAFQVTGVSVNDPNLETRLEAVRAGQEYRVFVTYTGGWEAAGLVRRTLTITTDDPEQPEIKVPVQAVLPSRAASSPAAPTLPAREGQ